ncbi:MAG: malto-oligosyltrehalose trehalohydrolase [Fibrobacter sp.]|nr:malto-oligosyltrehalose trehalohydrolase [Fibrobacter sp.]
MKIGATYRGDGWTSFTVWAPLRKSVAVKLVSPVERVVQMEQQAGGYWYAEIRDVFPGSHYFYKLDTSTERPDPASFYQPFGVHGPSEVIDHNAFKWSDSAWKGIPPEEMVIYELHTGTFTEDGTLESIIGKIDYLEKLGVSAIELMPLAQFPGERNWGYDGAYPFAVQNSYGGPEGLRKLVDICHSKGIAVLVDVVYNHLGPEGTYVQDYGPYFTHKYKTPWGDAINFDDMYSDGVRNFVIENALSWFEHYHIDALRLDAIQGIFDFGAKHILKELAEETDRFSSGSGRRRYLIAESDLNDVRVISSRENNGYGIDAQWNDDFHHAVQSLLTGERKSYYADYGTLDHLEKAFREGFIYSWDYSLNRRRHHGSSSVQVSGKQLVVCIQNHDQTGNRLMGERLSMLLPFEAVKLAAGAMFVSPFIPLLFMGEEFAAQTPFLYFISHTDKDLVQAVRDGRAREFADLYLGQSFYDPQDESTLAKSRLDWKEIASEKGKGCFIFYKEMIRLRKKIPAMASFDKKRIKVEALQQKNLIIIERHDESGCIAAIMNFGSGSTVIEPGIINFTGNRIIDSSEERFAGQGAVLPQKIEKDVSYEMPGYGFAVYEF